MMPNFNYASLPKISYHYYTCNPHHTYIPVAPQVHPISEWKVYSIDCHMKEVTYERYRLDGIRSYSVIFAQIRSDLLIFDHIRSDSRRFHRIRSSCLDSLIFAYIRLYSLRFDHIPLCLVIFAQILSYGSCSVIFTQIRA